MSKPTFIITADIHLRDDQPSCRTDNFFEAQAGKVAFTKELQAKYNIPVIDAGDLFHKWRPSIELISWAYKNLPDLFNSIPGNHDIPQHNLSLLDKSGLGLLSAVSKVHLIHEFPVLYSDSTIQGLAYGQSIDDLKKYEGTKTLRSVLVYHGLVYKGSPPWPGAEKEGIEVKELLRKAPSFDLIISGHNHSHFIAKDGDRLLINPGSLTRTTVDQVNYQPKVFLWYEDDNRIEAINIPIKDKVVRQELVSEVKKDERMEMFISRLRKDVEVGLSFEKNLSTFLSVNNISVEVAKEVWKMLDNNQQ